MTAAPDPTAHLPLSDELAAVFARMSGLLLSEDTVESGLSVLGALAQEAVPGSNGAGVSIIEGRRRRSSGSTDARVRQADALQYELDEGPCLTATTNREVVRVDDMATEHRWPTWSAAVLPLGLRATLSAPLVASDRTLGAIKVYSEQPNAFDARCEQLLTMFSAQAAILVAHVQPHERASRLSAGMRDAFRDRDVVSMAKGVLMGRSAVDEGTAFGMLLSRSQQEGSTVARTAQAVVDSAVRRRR